MTARSPLLAAICLAVACALAPAQTRVACLGDSITSGAGLPDREHLAWPAQLGARLASRYEVRSFGASGRTLSRAGDLPYVESDEWRAALEWRPQIAVVILGANDTVRTEARPNWRGSEGVARDARALAEALLGGGAVRVLLCTPTPMFPDAPGLDEARRAELFARVPRLELVRLALAEVAAELPGVELHDLARVFDASRTSDGVHPDPFGAEALAARVAGILARRPATALDIALRRHALDGAEVERGELAGFARHDFPLVGEELTCTVLAPHAPVLDDRGERPWLHRKRLDEARLELELAMLDRGFHVVFCDVAPSEESWTERERWRRFQALMSSLGLGERSFTELGDGDVKGADRLRVVEPRGRRWGRRRRGRDETVGARPAELLAAAGIGWNDAAWPATSAEHRAGAGWGGRSWHAEVEALRSLARGHPDVPIALLGDSITQGLTGSSDRLARRDGARAIDHWFGARGAISLGLSGDRTEHVLWRVENGALAHCDPRVVVVQVGVNNVLAAGHTGDETAEGIAAVCASLLDLEPQARIVVCGPFPSGATKDDPARAALAEARYLLPRHLDALGLVDDWRERVRMLDLWPLFLDDEGRPNARMRADHVHLTAEGEEAWLAALAPVVESLLE